MEGFSEIEKRLSDSHNEVTLKIDDLKRQLEELEGLHTQLDEMLDDLLELKVKVDEWLAEFDQLN
jgi:predicted nuclease with TOPRIM domain